ncbi:MAG: HNH endonuclease family protein [Cumulibacter sp.]
MAVVLLLVILGLGSLRDSNTPTPVQNDNPEVQGQTTSNTELARDVLAQLPVKGRAAKTGYSRSQFSSGWASFDGCDVRNRILASQLTQIELGEDDCSVLVGVLDDPYSGNQQVFVRGEMSSSEVQIDHVVALSDAWQKGAQALSEEDRLAFANDALNLLAVNGELNQAKGDSDAASWLPPNRAFRCQYVARQIAVKAKYDLWVTDAESAAMNRVLAGCSEQRLPSAS